MAGHKFIFVILLAAGVAASLLLVPGEKELGLVYYKEHQYTAAQRLFEKLYRSGDASRSDLAALVRIYLAEGNVSTAIDAYEHYLLRHDNDIGVWKKLEGLYRDAQRPYDEMRALEKIVSVEPTLKRWAKLADLYNRYDMGQKEEVALRTLVKLDPKRRRDQLALIRVLAGHGKLDEAAQVTDLYVQRFGSKVDSNMAELRLRLLISTGRMDDAFAWARQWLDTHPQMAVRYTAILYSGGASASAGTAFERAAAVDPARMPAWLIGAVMSAAWEQGKQTFLERFAERLSPEQREAYPVLMAGIALRKRDTEGLEKWLHAAAARTDLDVRQRLRLTEIYLNAGKVGKGLALMHRLAEEADEAPGEVPRGLADLVPELLKHDAVKEGFEIFDRLHRRRPGREVDAAWAILAAALGKRDHVTAWLDSTAGQQAPYRLLQDIYFAAADRSRQKTALAVARRAYARFHQKADALRLASALLAANKAKEALAVIEPFKGDSDTEVQQLREAALTAAWKQKAPVQDEVIALWKRQLEAPNLPTKRRRAIAYQLLDAGDKNGAIQVFQRLAEQEGPEGKDVRQLLFLWGPLPGAKALDWLEQRAKKAPAGELGGWWHYLVQAGGSERVLAMAADMGVELDAKAEDALMTALADSGDRQALDHQLIARAETERSLEKLERLAKKAELQGRNRAAERIWRRVHELYPENLAAMRALGIAAFYRDDRRHAREYLTRYLAKKEGDWESAFYLGEVLFAEGQKQKARTYYRRSLTEIDAKPRPSRRQRVARAQILRHMGRLREAIAAFDKLLTEYPDDVDIRAEYAALLVDEGRLEQAQRLLKGSD